MSNAKPSAKLHSHILTFTWVLFCYLELNMDSLAHHLSSKTSSHSGFSLHFPSHPGLILRYLFSSPVSYQLMCLFTPLFH